MILKIGLGVLLILAVVSAKSLKIPIEKKLIQSSVNDDSASFLFSLNGLYYVTNMTVGTPPQLFTIGFSNGIDISFIPSVSCNTCKAKNLFDGSKSSTYKSTGSTVSILMNNPVRTKIDGNLSVEFFSFNYYPMPDQLFVEVAQETNYDLPLDGMISLALNKNNFIFNLYSQGLVTDPVVGYFISHIDGQISYGEPDLGHYSGDLNYFKLTLGPTWALPLDNYLPNDGGQSVNHIAIFDVAVHNIESGPTTTKQINEALGAELQEDGSYHFDCNKLDQYTSFTFIFKGLSYVLDPKDYILMEDNKCISYFVTSNFYDDSVFNIGQPFFRKYYTVFDFGNERIGFATAR